MRVFITHQTYILLVALMSLLVQTPDYAFVFQGVGVIVVFTMSLGNIYFFNNKFRANWISVPIFAFVLYLTISLMWSQVLGESLLWYGAYMVMPLYLYSLHFTHEKIIDFSIFYKFLYFVGFWVSLYAIYQFVFDAGYWSDMAHYPFHNANSLAIFIGVFGFLGLNFLLKEENVKWLSLFVFGCFLTLLGLLVTHSRGAMIGFFVVFVVMGGFYWRCCGLDKQLRRYCCVGIGLLVVSVIAPFLIENNVEGLVAPSQDLVKSRVVIWEASIQAALSTYPWFGSGIGVFEHVYLGFKSVADRTEGHHAHNDLLHLWVELGIVGLLPIFLLMIGFVKGLIIFWQNKCFDFVLPLCLLIWCGGLSMMTPIILLPFIMMIVAISLFQISSLLPFRCLKKSFFKAIGGIVVVVCICISLQTIVRDFASYKMRLAVSVGALEDFLFFSNVVDHVSLYQDPLVPIYKKTVLEGMVQIDLLEKGQVDKAYQDIELYGEEAKKRNPYYGIVVDTVK